MSREGRGRTPRGWTGAIGGTVLLGFCACSVLGAPSKVHEGALYVSGSTRYDAYFAEIHALQVAAAAWPAERRDARKPLLDALKLPPDADDSAIVQSTKDSLSTGLLRLEVKGSDVHVIEGGAASRENPREILAAVELTAHAEIERGKTLSGLPAQAETLAKSGHDLETHLAGDFAGEGQKPFEVKEELHASYDALSELAEGAARERRAADQLVTELGRAVSAGSDVTTTAPPALQKTKPVKAPSSPKPEGKPAAKPAPPPRAEPIAASPNAVPPPPAPPKPAAKPADTEVFNP